MTDLLYHQNPFNPTDSTDYYKKFNNAVTI